MKLSPQQAAVVGWVQNGSGSALVRARAGTGKTTLLLQCMKHMTGTIAVAAFNNKISKEISAKAAAMGLRATIKTFHGFGYSAWRNVFPAVKLSGTDRGQAGYDKADAIANKLEIPKSLRKFVRSAVSIAKQRCVGILCQIEDQAAWNAIVEDFSLEEEICDDFGQELTTTQRLAMIPHGIEFSIKALKLNIEIAPEVIDFDDMLFMPLYGKVKFFQNDWVLVDEAQDTNPARRMMARQMLKRSGRAILVGDEKQAIYAFTGADNDALDLVGAEFNCTEFPLTVTYRCPKAVVAHANRLVADYQAHEDAPEGEVLSMGETDFLKMELAPSDAIICRNTAPLIDIAFGLLRRGVACKVEGKDIGKSLVKLLNRFRKVKTIPALVDALTRYCDRETVLLREKKKNAQAASLEDRVETLLAIIEGMGKSAAKFSDVEEKIESMFEDTNGNRKDMVTLMTAHRSKGLEFPRVFLFGENLYMPSPWARDAAALQQETNLRYVAYTRAEKTLVIVDANPKKK